LGCGGVRCCCATGESGTKNQRTRAGRWLVRLLLPAQPL
jgi:hypothetical protein